MHQVAMSGKPSIGISSCMEQEMNGKALGDLGIATHFKLKDLWYDKDGAVAAFQSCITGHFAVGTLTIDGSVLKRVADDVAKEDVVLPKACRDSGHKQDRCANSGNEIQTIPSAGARRLPKLRPRFSLRVTWAKNGLWPISLLGRPLAALRAAMRITNSPG